MTLLIRWTCCPPQGAHTSHLRTLSKIECCGAFPPPRSSNISSERAAYYTTNFVSVNTFLKNLFEKFCRDSFLRSCQRRPRSRGANLTTDFHFVNTLEANFLLPDIDDPGGSSPSPFARNQAVNEGARILTIWESFGKGVRRFFYTLVAAASCRRYFARRIGRRKAAPTLRPRRVARARCRCRATKDRRTLRQTAFTNRSTPNLPHSLRPRPSRQVRNTTTAASQRRPASLCRPASL